MITHSQSEALLKKAVGAFVTSFKGLETEYDVGKWLTTFSTTKNEIDWAWASAVPFPVEWIGRRTHQRIFDHAYSAKPKKWDLTLDIAVETWEDDQTGTIAERATGAARKARAFLGKRFTDIMVDGLTGAVHLSHDGLALYSASHVVQGTGGTYSNYHTASGTTVPTAPTVTELETALSNLYALVDQAVDDFGNPIDIPGEPTFHIPYNFRGVFMKVAGSTSEFGRAFREGDSAGATGRFVGAQFKVNKFASAVTDTFFVTFPAAPGLVGPFVLGDRSKWRVKTWDPSNSDEQDDKDTISVRLRSRWEIVPGMPQLTYAVKFTA